MAALKKWSKNSAMNPPIHENDKTKLFSSQQKTPAEQKKSLSAKLLLAQRASSDVSCREKKKGRQINGGPQKMETHLI